ncbi:MAG: hypothetical protein ACM3VW_03355 [Bacteroidota bacterium]|nr:hypothetical protein [Tepidisphaeraceae bacterium]
MQCTFDLDEAQVQLLIDVLGREQRELRDEILHTDKKAYRERLHERLENVENVAAQLEAQVRETADV